MIAKTQSCGLILDLSLPEYLVGTQRWVLSAMQGHGQELVTMLWRILGNEQDVCDAYQDTFLKLAHYHRDQKPEHVKAYIFRSASNVAISMLRRKIMEKRNLPRLNPNQNNTSPANELDAKDLQENLRYSVSRLPENLRSVITLHDLGELSYSQTGKILGITESTARVYRCKAVQLLAVLMKRKES